MTFMFNVGQVTSEGHGSDLCPKQLYDLDADTNGTADTPTQNFSMDGPYIFVSCPVTARSQYKSEYTIVNCNQL